MKKKITITIDAEKHRSLFADFSNALSGGDQDRYRAVLKSTTDKSERDLVLLFWLFAHTNRGIGIDGDAINEISIALANHVCGVINPFNFPWLSVPEPKTGGAYNSKKERAYNFCNAVIKKVLDEDVTIHAAINQLMGQYGYTVYKTAESAFYPRKDKDRNTNKIDTIKTARTGRNEIFNKLSASNSKQSSNVPEK